MIFYVASLLGNNVFNKKHIDVSLKALAKVQFGNRKNKLFAKKKKNKIDKSLGISKKIAQKFQSLAFLDTNNMVNAWGI